MGRPNFTPLVAIVGPTGSGKSAAGLRVAETFGGEIVNCDSLQLYRYLDIGTAKLTPQERGAVPHHLMDVLNPDQVFTAGEYARQARSTLGDIAARGCLGIIVGGTGFYLRSLLQGLFAGPRRNEPLRARLRARAARRPGSLHRLLTRFDPEAARRIQPGDVQKLVRALEVCLLTGRPLSEWFASGRDALTGYRTLKIGLNPPREALYRKLDARCLRMFESGLIDEVRRVLALGFPADSKALEAHGYRQAVQVIEGRLSLDEAVYHARRNTRRYAKRQWTWFRGDPDVVWLNGFGEDAAVQESALNRVERFLSCEDHAPEPV